MDQVMTTQRFDNGHRVEVAGTSWRHYDQHNVCINWDVARTPHEARAQAHRSIRHWGGGGVL